MDASWTLDLLSTRGLDQSILLTVLLGLWVMLLFSETLGWVFIGVVVPGYLASIIVISPTSAAAIVCEAVSTLIIARALAVTMAKTGVWTQFFGRDRFFLIVMISVWVRQISQTLVLPTLEHFLREHGYPSLTLTEDFSSIGLVLVPLTANMFWRLSLARGLLQFGTVVGLTYALLRWVLLPYTNLSDASLILLYEDSAIDFLSNAKSYIVLLVTAYLASIANLRYGWDFGGILIAALLSLLWWTPLKLVLTLLEAVLLYWATVGLLRLPWVRGLNLEGPRKIAIVFSYAFGLKCIVGAVMGDSFPGLKVTDLFAFGYLMSSILVVRMMVVGSMRQVLLPVALTSAVGFCVSSLLGLWLAQLSHGLFETPSPEQKSQLVSKRSLSSVQGVLGYTSVRRSSARSWNPSAQKRELRNRAELWETLATALQNPSWTLPSHWRNKVAQTHMHWSRLSSDQDTRPLSLLHPGEDDQGNPYDGPIVLLRHGAPGPSLLVQWPEQHPGLAEAAWLECLQSDCATLTLISQSARARDRELKATVQSGDHALIDAMRTTRPLWHIVFSDSLQRGQKHLHLDSSHQDKRAFLRQDLRYMWSPAPEAKALKAKPQDRVLRLPRVDNDRNIARHWKSSLSTLPQTSLAEYLQSQRASAQRGSGETPLAEPIPFSATELRILQQRVIQGLIELSSQDTLDPERLAALSYWGAPLGVRIDWLDACATQGCLVVTLQDEHQRLVWALAHRWQDDSDVQVPRPSRERGTMGLGLALFDAFSLRSVLVHMGDWRFDPTHVSQVFSAYHAIHQALDESTNKNQSSLALILRGIRSDIQTFEPSDGQEETVLVGLGYPVLTPLERSDKLSEWSTADGPLRFLGRLRWSDATQAHYRYSGAQIPQVKYSRLLGKKQPMVLWVPSGVRSRYVHQHPSHWRDLVLLLSGSSKGATPRKRPETLPLINELDYIAQLDDPLATDCSQARFSAKSPSLEQHERRWETLLSLAERFARHHHPHDLQSIAKKVKAQADNQIQLVKGHKSGSLFLALQVQDSHTRYRALISLGDAKEQRRSVPLQHSNPAGLRRWLAAVLLERNRTFISIRCHKESP